MLLETVEIEKAYIKNLGNRIICLEFKNNVEFELEDAIETDKIFYKMAKGKPFLTLIDARVFGNISNEARAFFADDDLVKDIRIAQAIVLTSLSIRIVAKFYIRYNKPKDPVKIFNNKKAAIGWLLTQYSPTK